MRALKKRRASRPGDGHLHGATGEGNLASRRGRVSSSGIWRHPPPSSGAPRIRPPPYTESFLNTTIINEVKPGELRLLNCLFSDLEVWERLPSVMSGLTVAIVGPRLAGKSTLCRRLLGLERTYTYQQWRHDSRRVDPRTVHSGAVYQCTCCPPPSCYRATDDHGGALVLRVTVSDFLKTADLFPLRREFDVTLYVTGNLHAMPELDSAVLAGLEVLRISSKCDLVDEASAPPGYLRVSGQHDINVDVIRQMLCTFESRTTAEEACFSISKSWDANRPGCAVDDIRGGMLSSNGRSLSKIVEIRPGVLNKDDGGVVEARPLFTSFVGSDETTLDPTLCRGDRMVGQVVGPPGGLPPVFEELAVTYTVFGAHTAPAVGDSLKFDVGSCMTGARVISCRAGWMHLRLMKPVCCEEGWDVSLSRRIKKHWQLIMLGRVQAGLKETQLRMSTHWSVATHRWFDAGVRSTILMFLLMARRFKIPRDLTYIICKLIADEQSPH